jgi:hypothetical protein
MALQIHVMAWNVVPPPFVFSELRLEVIVRFVDIDINFDNHCLNIIFIIVP